MNPYYNRLFNPAPLTFARSGEVIAEYERVKQGFDGVKAKFDLVDLYGDEVVVARQGQATLLANIQRYLSTFAPASASLDMGGFRVTNLGSAQNSGDAVTFAQLIAATTPGNPPAASADTYGLSLTNQGGTASYSLSTPDALAYAAMGVI